ncbi:MAG: indolepyruvate ferredoxin oxidoreductase subunit alpha [Candidatus Hydrothermarchaeota archaeon]
MARPDILNGETGEKVFLLGNEAIARGAIEAGVKVVASYPGTPSSEILESIARVAKELNIHAEWSVNEKAALEIAAGASYSGVRAMASMKHVGVNVALDALVTLAYTGVRGGLVIVSADDPSAHSSQNEQDNRLIARFAKIFCLEPYDPQSAKDYTKKAFEISERFEIPVMLRTTTRVSHARGDVEFGEVIHQKKANFKKDPKRFVCVPAHSRPLHANLNKKLKDMEKYSEESELNYSEINDKLGVISSGVSRNYVREALHLLGLKASVFEIGITHPLPRKRLIDFLNNVERVLIVEELEPYIEEYVKSLGTGIKIDGKSLLPREFELSVDIVKKAISGLVGISHKESKIDVIDIPSRPPVMCAGCPHRAVFYALKKITKKKIYSGDIGCYTLGVSEPLKTIDTCLCMGAGISLGAGLYHAGVEDKIVAIIGDSTFLHAGMTGLLNAVYNNANITIVILDNMGSAMTGHQPHPAVGVTATGEKTFKVDFEQIAKALGAGFVAKIKPFDLEDSIETLRKALDFNGVSVVIAEEPCALVAKKLNLWKSPYRVDRDKCDGYLCHECRACVFLIDCPAINWENGKAKVIRELCSGCGLCFKICPNNAFVVD